MSENCPLIVVGSGADLEGAFMTLAIRINLLQAKILSWSTPKCEWFAFGLDIIKKMLFSRTFKQTGFRCKWKAKL